MLPGVNGFAVSSRMRIDASDRRDWLVSVLSGGNLNSITSLGNAVDAIDPVTRSNSFQSGLYAENLLLYPNSRQTDIGNDIVKFDTKIDSAAVETTLPSSKEDQTVSLWPYIMGLYTDESLK